MVLLGFRYLASSIPLICLAGVAIGVGVIFAFLVLSICRNPSLSNSLVRWAFIGFSLVEVSGFIGLVYSFLILYAFSFYSRFINFYIHWNCFDRQHDWYDDWSKASIKVLFMLWTIFLYSICYSPWVFLWD